MSLIIHVHNKRIIIHFLGWIGGKMQKLYELYLHSPLLANGHPKSQNSRSDNVEKCHLWRVMSLSESEWLSLGDQQPRAWTSSTSWRNLLRLSCVWARDGRQGSSVTHKPTEVIQLQSSRTPQGHSLGPSKGNR